MSLKPPTLGPEVERMAPEDSLKPPTESVEAAALDDSLKPPTLNAEADSLKPPTSA